MTLIDRPLIQYAIDEAREAGIEEFTFVTSRGKSALEDYFDEAAYLRAELERKGKAQLLGILDKTEMASGAIAYVRQTQALGLGHAVWCARRLVGNEPVAVLLPDDVIAGSTGCLKQMVETYERTGGNLVAVENVPADQTFRYGILDPETDDGKLVKIRGMVEKPAPEEAPSDLAIIGRYILDPMIMETLDKGKKGAGGEIQITDAMADLIGTCPLHGLRFKGTRYDCGNKAGFLAANLAYAALDPELVEGLQEQIRTIFK